MLFSMRLYKSVSSFKIFDPLIEDLSKKGGISSLFSRESERTSRGMGLQRLGSPEDARAEFSPLVFLLGTPWNQRTFRKVILDP